MRTKGELNTLLNIPPSANVKNSELNVLSRERVDNNKLLDNEYLSKEDSTYECNNGNIVFNKCKVLEQELHEPISKDKVIFCIELGKKINNY